jgi:branched-chain amino acid transport system permease protein|tara:strand:- start:252 stop:1175 length:924 start_codon:yes stop_codon:yes gene_type:complete
MDWTLFVTQMLNGLQLGVLLFLLASGLTLIFGVMDFVNLAHGSLYMVGAYFCASLTDFTGSFVLAVLLALPLTALVGLAVEFIVIRRLYARDHLDHVLATFGLILCFDTAVQFLWGPEGMAIALPAVLDGQVEILPEIVFPTFRLLIIAVGLVVALGLYVVVTRTRAGMLIRAGASNRTMVAALGIDIQRLFALVFAAGSAMAGLAGMMIAPITEASIGMGNEIIIIAFVVIIIGGIGSIKGAFVAAVLVGLIDTMGRSFLDTLLKVVVSDQNAETAAPALSAMLIYILMAAILAFQPQGLFPPKGR